MTNITIDGKDITLNDSLSVLIKEELRTFSISNIYLLINDQQLLDLGKRVVEVRLCYHYFNKKCFAGIVNIMRRRFETQTLLNQKYFTGDQLSVKSTIDVVFRIIRSPTIQMKDS